MSKKAESTAPRHHLGTRVLKIGARVLCMTPTTHYWTGRVVDFDALSIVLEDSAWIPQLGRHTQAIATGVLEEVEAHPDMIEIPRIGTVVVPWDHELPRQQKPAA